MNRTIFRTPGVNSLLRAFSRAFLRCTGWTIEGSLPAHAHKSVLIAAPHTSNWDLPYTLMAAFALRLQIQWMGKSSLFRWPFGGVMRWLGGIPVQRDSSNNMVALTAQAIHAASGPLQLVLSPEGTRSQVRQWKSGFYYIALQAQVPIVMAYLDFGGKRCGLGPALLPSGDLAADMAKIQAFYAPFRGKRPGHSTIGPGPGSP